MKANSTGSFESELIRLLPSMRIWALALTRSAQAADDLVQDVAMKALAAKASFTPETNFKAWIHRIMFNKFIANVRTQRDFVSVDDLQEIPVAAEQLAKIDLERLGNEFDRLPEYLKDALRQIVIEDRSYEDFSATSGCAVGTLKSRVHRARVILRGRMEGEERSAA